MGMAEWYTASLIRLLAPFKKFLYGVLGKHKMWVVEVLKSSHFFFFFFGACHIQQCSRLSFGSGLTSSSAWGNIMEC